MHTSFTICTDWTEEKPGPAQTTAKVRLATNPHKQTGEIVMKFREVTTMTTL